MLDHVDFQIIRLLQKNARMQYKQIGELVHMSAPAVANRIHRLEELGVIEAFTVKVDEKKMGNPYCVFITVMMKNYQHTKFKEFIQSRDEIREAHRVSGEPCFIMKVVLSDQDKLAELLDEILVYGHYKVNISIDECK